MPQRSDYYGIRILSLGDARCDTRNNTLIKKNLLFMWTKEVSLRALFQHRAVLLNTYRPYVPMKHDIWACIAIKAGIEQAMVGISGVHEWRGQWAGTKRRHQPAIDLHVVVTDPHAG